MVKGIILATLPQSVPMYGGDGPHSYVRNSSYQKAATDCARAKIKEAILEKLDLCSTNSDNRTFKVADFGCSVGPNTFDAVQNIIETVKLKCQNERNHNQLEFHVLLNDQSSNDFNTLFRNLSLSVCRQYFVAGVPGSFYGRVFPRNTINIGHTSYTLHWLSKVPQDICNRSSPAWNKDSIQCTNLVEEVSNAYKAQFEKDMGAFLEARAQELVPRGLMIMSGIYLPHGVPMAQTWMGVAVDMIGDCLIDMANSGILSKERVESFSLPIYFPHTSELRRVIEQNGCFSIEEMERIIHPMEDSPLSNDSTVSLFRAVYGGVFEEYFGCGVVDELFDRYAKKLAECPIDYNKCDKVMQYFILLKRNVY